MRYTLKTSSAESGTTAMLQKEDEHVKNKDACNFNKIYKW